MQKVNEMLGAQFPYIRCSRFNFLIMQDYVNFETAVKLKQAGFPQPKRYFGQVWYFLHTAEPVLVGSAMGNELEKYESVFAPRATDLLAALDVRYCLWFEKGIFELRWAREFELVASGGNPAQAIADYYLS